MSDLHNIHPASLPLGVTTTTTTSTCKPPKWVPALFFCTTLWQTLPCCCLSLTVVPFIPVCCCITPHALSWCPAGAAAAAGSEAQGGRDSEAGDEVEEADAVRRMSTDSPDAEVGACAAHCRKLCIHDCAACWSSPAMRCVWLCPAVCLQHCM